MLDRTLGNATVLELAGALASKLSHESLTKHDLRSLISLLTSTLCDAQSYYNTLMPVGRLPDETLCAIFESLEKVEPNPEILWPMSRSIRGVTPMTWVCRRWRNVALACSSLWAAITLDGTSDSTRMSSWLQRSRNVPLHLSTRNWDDQCVKQTMRDHVWRIRELHIVRHDTTPPFRDLDMFEDSLFPNDEFTAAQLERLTVCRFVNTSGPVSDTAPPLLQGRAPNLKRLSLRGDSWLTGNQATHLTHLQLSDCPQITPLSLLGVLSNNRGLEELILTECRMATGDYPSPDSTPIPLAHMRRLVLGGSKFYRDSEWMTWLVDQLEFGPQTSVRLVDQCLSGIRIADRRQPLTHDIDALALSYIPSTRLFSTIGVVKNSELGFRVDEDQYALRAHRHVPFPSLRELWLTSRLGWYNYREFMWSLAAFPALETLVVAQEHVELLTRASKAECPALQAMHIFVSDLTDTVKDDIRNLATALATSPSKILTVDVGFPGAEMLERFKADDVLPLDGDGPTVYRLKLHSEMPVLRMPRASTVDTHEFWPSWTDSFPLDLFN